MTKGKTPFSEARAKIKFCMSKHLGLGRSRPGSGRVRICLACNHNGDMPSPPVEPPKKLKSVLKKQSRGYVDSGQRHESQGASGDAITKHSLSTDSFLYRLRTKV